MRTTADPDNVNAARCTTPKRLLGTATRGRPTVTRGALQRGARAQAGGIHAEYLGGPGDGCRVPGTRFRYGGCGIDQSMVPVYIKPPPCDRH